MRRTLASLVIAGGLLASPPGWAAGGPVITSLVPAHGIRAGSLTYVAHPGRHSTLVQVLPSGPARVVRGRFGIPVIAYDGTPAGVSADGSTLVLARPRNPQGGFPARSSELLVLDVGTLAPRRLIWLRGDFSLDAVSPDGRWLYLIDYRMQRVRPRRGSPYEMPVYSVRALDSRTGHLLARAIVDPHDRGEKMQGDPVSRVTSPNGRWAYTLYSSYPRPFIHALDTVRRTARCIDLLAFARRLDPFSARLALSGSTLRVRYGARVLSALDVRSLRLIPVARTPAAARESSAAGPDGFAVIALVLLALAGVAVGLRLRGHAPAVLQLRSRRSRPG